MRAPTDRQILLYFNKDKKQLTKLKSKDLYWMLLEQINKQEGLIQNIPAVKKWTSFYPHEMFNWQTIFTLPFKTCANPKLQTLQYRIIHRVITCNHWLYNAKIKASPICDICGEDDTLIHFFFMCSNVRQLWSSLVHWWKRILKRPNYDLTQIELLFGVPETTECHININYIILLMKKFIHDLKLVNQENLSFVTFLLTLKQNLGYEKEISIRNGKECIFERKWNWCYEQL